MESTKKGMPLDTPNLSNYRLTGESVPTAQRYKIHSFFNQFRRFYTCAIVEISKHLVR